MGSLFLSARTIDQAKELGQYPWIGEDLRLPSRIPAESEDVPADEL